MRIFSGIQPTGRKHLGNYIGAIVQYVAGQERGEAIYCIVDLHATTVAFDPAELRELTYDTAAILLAAGLDPERCILFRQSDVHEHAELAWLLTSVTAYGDLQRMTQFKDKSAKQRELVTAGLFFYPVLMAADVLAYRTDEVPVGEDQRQHVELMRDIAISGEGMVFVLDEPAQIERKFKRAVTDSGRGVRRGADKPGISNLIDVLAAVRAVAPEQVEREFADAGYGDFKAAVAAAVTEYLAPVRERYNQLHADRAALETVLAAGAERARAIASATLADVRDAMGVGTPR